MVQSVRIENILAPDDLGSSDVHASFVVSSWPDPADGACWCRWALSHRYSRGWPHRRIQWQPDWSGLVSAEGSPVHHGLVTKYLSITILFIIDLFNCLYVYMHFHYVTFRTFKSPFQHGQYIVSSKIIFTMDSQECPLKSYLTCTVHSVQYNHIHHGQSTVSSIIIFNLYSAQCATIIFTCTVQCPV